MKILVACAALGAALVVPASGAAAGPIAGVRECPDHHFGVIVYHVDYNTGGPIDLVTICVPLEE